MDKDRKYTKSGIPPEIFNSSRFKLAFEDQTVQVYEDAEYQHRLQWLSGNGEIVWNRYQSDLIQVTVSHNKTDDLIYRSIIYPGWTYYLDGKPTEINTEKAGYILITIPEGAHEMVISYQPTTFRISLKITAFSFMLWLLFFVAVCRKHIATFYSKKRHI